MDSEFLLPFRGRNRSGALDVNFLWRWRGLYVMDNHLAAPWCFWQHMDSADTWDFMHIDRHYDALWQTFRPWTPALRDVHRRDLAKYLAASIRKDSIDMKLYRWDTVVSSLLALDREKFGRVLLVTGQDGDPVDDPGAVEQTPWQFLRDLEYAVYEAGDGKAPWYVDLDLDYFTTADDDGESVQLFGDAFVRRVGRVIRDGHLAGRIPVVTVAMSPETTGSWELAEHLLSQLLDEWPDTPKLA